MIQWHMPKIEKQARLLALLTSPKRTVYNIHITSGKENLESSEQQPVHISLAVALRLQPPR